jgi:hypothetical protein
MVNEEPEQKLLHDEFDKDWLVFAAGNKLFGH